jgi:hypothetical protein
VPTIRWKNIERTMLIVHAKVQPDPSEWAACCRDTAAMGRSLEHTLVFADVTLSATQRRDVATILKNAGTRSVAVITTSQLARMVVTALGWMSGVHRAFDPSEIKAALAYLAVSEAEQRELLTTALRFARELHHTSLEETLAAAA